MVPGPQEAEQDPYQVQYQSQSIGQGVNEYVFEVVGLLGASQSPSATCEFVLDCIHFTPRVTVSDQQDTEAEGNASAVQ